MGDLSTNSATPLDPSSALKPSLGSTHQSPEAPLPPPTSTLPQESSDGSDGWRTIGEQEFYNEKDFLRPSYNLTSEKLKDRKEDDVVIFDYSLSRADENPPVEEGGPSSGHFSAHDIFFQVSNGGLIESKQFKGILGPMEQPRPMDSRGPRLAIIDFPQCYDTYDNNLLNSMAKELHLPDAATFGDAHSKRVRALPGRERFGTGISLRVPSKKPSDLPKSSSPEDRITLFVSFPYFGRSSSSIPLGPEGESVRLLDFKRLGVCVPDGSTAVIGEEEGDIGGILIHQTRYMVFDNYTMATFRSKEDSAKDQVPLHRFQERASAFHAMIHMIANRMDSEVWTFGKLQALLFKLEEDIGQMILDAKIHEDNQEMEESPDDDPQNQGQSPEKTLTEEQRLEWKERARQDNVRPRQDNVRKRKHRRVRELLASLNSLSAALFATISVAERQISVLQDLHSLSLTSYRTQTQDYKGRPLGKKTFYKNIAPMPTPPENSEQIWLDSLDAIDEVIRERKCFIEKIKALVENMEARREILFGFLKSDNLEPAPSERRALEVIAIVKRIEDSLKKASATQESYAMQTIQTANAGIILSTLFTISLCTSYYGMSNIKEFNEHPISLKEFWLATVPVLAGVMLLIIVVILWKRPWAIALRSQGAKWSMRSPAEKKPSGFPLRRTDIESLASPAPGFRGWEGDSPQGPPGSTPCLSITPPPRVLVVAPQGHTPTDTTISGISDLGPSSDCIPLVRKLPPPPGSGLAEQQFPTGANPTNPMSLRDTERASFPVPSEGAPGTSSLLAGSRDLVPHPGDQDRGLGDGGYDGQTLLCHRGSSSGNHIDQKMDGSGEGKKT